MGSSVVTVGRNRGTLVGPRDPASPGAVRAASDAQIWQQLIAPIEWDTDAEEAQRELKKLASQYKPIIEVTTEVKEVLSNYICSDTIETQKLEFNISNVTVAFLTDGESGEDRNKLLINFKNILKNCWKGPISINSIGFGKNCDK